MKTNKRTKEMLNFFVLVVFLFYFNESSAQTYNHISSGLPNFRSSGLSQVEENFMAQLKAYPQEKIHLHTDRNFYVPGEKIWFKAYVTDAVNHLYPTYSRYVYAELIDSRDSLVVRVMVRPENDMFYGHLFLSEIIPEGNYTLRAYTRYMENLGDDYFFKKNIRIGNITPALSFGEGAGGGESTERNLIRSDYRGRIQDDYDVSFFPEGGNLPEEALCKVAFKALNRDGTQGNISGEIVDENDTVITSVQSFHAGMGVFIFMPQPGKRYWMKCRHENGLEKQFELPQSNAQTCALTVTQRNKMLMAGIQKSAQWHDIPCYLLVHCRGIVLYYAAWDYEKDFIVFPEEDLPAGVIQFVLFDEQMNPLSERLVFSKNYEEVKVGFHTDKAVYEKREKVISTLSLTPSLLERAGVRLSLAITDDADIAIDSTTTILSSLLLSSELKGYIENPAWYLQDHNESVIALDYLMMTHGWRRYHIPEVVKGNPAYPQIPFQESQEISGKVKSLFLSRPVSDSEILIMAQDGNMGFSSTNGDGIFLFQDLEYPDSASFFIQALNSKGSNQVELIVDEESFPKLIYAPQSHITDMPVINEEAKRVFDTNAFLLKATQRSRYDDDMRIIHLSEVEVTAPRIERKDEARLQFWANAGSDVTIRREDFEKRNPLTVSDMLRGVPGVTVLPNGAVFIRGPGSLRGAIQPLVLIDGTPVAWPSDMSNSSESPLESVHVNNVESIDVFKGVSAAKFGIRGGGGAISITTRKGEEMNRPEEEFNYTVYSPLGYQKPVEFYSPRYETLETRYLSISDYRTTIFWKPDIIISEEGETTFDFYTSDFPTTYSVVIEGLTTDGRIVRQVEKIQVE